MAPRAGVAVGISLALMRAAPSAIVAMDVDGRITSLNPAAETLLSTTTESAVGRPYTSVFGASLSDRMVGLFMRVARSGGPGEPQTLRATLPGGRRATLRASAGPLRDAKGDLAGILFVAEDRTAEGEQASRAERLRRALHRYTGDAVASLVEERPSFIDVGGVTQVVSVLHADVRGYTAFAEGLAPERVLGMLRRYHGAAATAIEACGGVLDRFIGDAVLALWNAPRPQERHARLALEGALAMLAATRAVGSELAYGIGVRTGEAVVGNLGSERFANYTAIGDTVNVAARLQAAAPAGAILCSAATLAAAGGAARAQALGPLAVKGRRGAVETYRLEAL